MNTYYVFSLPPPPIQTTFPPVISYPVTSTPPAYSATSSTSANYDGNGGSSFIFSTSTTEYSSEASSTQDYEALANCECYSDQAAVIALGSLCRLFFIAI